MGISLSVWNTRIAHGQYTKQCVSAAGLVEHKDSTSRLSGLLQGWWNIRIQHDQQAKWSATGLVEHKDLTWHNLQMGCNPGSALHFVFWSGRAIGVKV